MRPNDVLATVTALLPTARPLYLWRPPGIGKSSLVRQAAASLQRELVDMRATLLDPVDLRGLPHLSDDRAVRCPPAFLPRGGSGVLFLDELAQATPLVQALPEKDTLRNESHYDRHTWRADLPYAECERQKPPLEPFGKIKRHQFLGCLLSHFERVAA